MFDRIAPLYSKLPQSKIILKALITLNVCSSSREMSIGSLFSFDFINKIYRLDSIPFSTCAKDIVPSKRSGEPGGCP